jgi:hypothetical protein
MLLVLVPEGGFHEIGLQQRVFVAQGAPETWAESCGQPNAIAVRYRHREVVSQASGLGPGACSRPSLVLPVAQSRVQSGGSEP